MRESLECRVDLLRGSPELSGRHSPEILFEVRRNAQTAASKRALDRFVVELLLADVRPGMRARNPLRVDDTRRDKGDAAGLETVGPHFVKKCVDGSLRRMARRLASAPPSLLAGATAISQLLVIGVQ